MKNLLPDEGERLLIITLEMESAAISGRWREFDQLAEARGAELDRLAECDAAIAHQIAERIEEVDARMALSLVGRKKKIAQDLGKLARFKKSLLSAARL